MPRMEIIRAIPSLREDQKKVINDYFNETQKKIQPCDEQIRGLEAKQKELKNAPAQPKATDNQATPPLSNQKMAIIALSQAGVQSPTAPSQSEMTTQLEAAKEKKKELARTLTQQINAVLTDDQRLELDQMRHGTLIISPPEREPDLTAKNDRAK